MTFSDATLVAPAYIAPGVVLHILNPLDNEHDGAKHELGKLEGLRLDEVWYIYGKTSIFMAVEGD